MEHVDVLIVDDEALVRHALRIFINSAGGMQVAGEASDGAEALRLCGETRPDVVLMDIQMPVMGGVEATTRIVSRFPEVKVLAVTTFSTERHVVSALRAGASGYLVKDTSPDALAQAIQDVHEGRSALSPKIAQELVRVVNGTTGTVADQLKDSLGNLTDRELSVVNLLAEGLSNSEIASRLYVSEATVKSNLGRIMQKWGARDRVQVLIHAARTGLVTF